MAVIDRARFTSSKDAVVNKKVKVKYLKLIDRFFWENVNLIEPEQRGYFWGLMDNAVDHYCAECV